MTPPTEILPPPFVLVVRRGSPARRVDAVRCPRCRCRAGVAYEEEDEKGTVLRYYPCACGSVSTRAYETR